MASKSFTGKGSILSVGSGGATETFQAVGEVTDIKWSGFEMGTVDSTSLQSVNKEVIATGLIDYGTVDIEAKMLPADIGQTDIGQYFVAGILRDFELQLPLAPGQTTKGNLIAFTGFITKYNPNVDVTAEKEITFSFTCKINVAPTVTPGS